jgi:dipeptidyl aminopeptidase/acylaminoacyl peptidase
MITRSRISEGYCRIDERRHVSTRLYLRFIALVWTSILTLTSTSSGNCQAPIDSKVDLIRGDEITLKLIMSDQDWLGRQPENAYWGDLSESFYFSRKRPEVAINDLYRASAIEQNPATRVTPDHAARESVAGGVWRYSPESRSFTEKVYIRKGDVYHRNLTDGHITQLTRTTTSESQPLFLNDGSIGFRRGDQFLVRDLETGLESEPFPLVFAKEPSEKKIDDAKKKSLQARQQERLFDIVKKKEKQKNLREAEQRLINREDPSLPGTPFYLGEDFELGPTALSPSGRHLAVVLLPKKRPKPSKTKMPDWVTASGDIETRDVRHKVGTGKPYQSKLMLLDRETRKLVEIKTDALPEIATDPLKALRKAAKDREENRKKELEKTTNKSGDNESEDSPKTAEKEKDADPKPRPLQFRSLAFNHDGSALAFQAFSFDNKDRWLVSVDLETGSCRPLHHLYDPAWINWRHNQYGWSSDGSKVWFQSEESGFSHLYIVALPSTDSPDAELSAPIALTRGTYIATEPQLSVDGRYLYFRANKEHPGQYEIYRTTLTDGTVQQITQLGGMSSALLSPNGRQLLITHSESTRPPELFIQSAEPATSAVRRTDTVSDAFERRPWITPKHVEVPSNHGQNPIHSRLYLPPEDRATKRPAIMFVHGAGYLQNAHKGWSGYSREFMFHSFLAKRGFVVLDMDYRASAGYGRDWRTAIYRHMGSVELEDLRDGVDWLVDNHEVDRDRIGVYGGSYGGFLTLMALFNESDLFAAGAALRPVTDWAHYNHGYTSRILNTPELDPDAYMKSSPIEFAQGLKKPLLICAPMLDDNVFFQDSVRLVQRLIELEKEDWWIAPYPIEPHGFREPTSWLDEYRRIWDLFERYL